MAITTIQTNNPQIPFVTLNEESREFTFEYGAQLIEYTFIIPGGFSIPIFLGDLTSSIETNKFAEFLERSLTYSVIIPTGENGTLTPPMLLALKVPVQETPVETPVV